MQPRRVALYGNSLFIASIQASLSNTADLDVVRLETSLPDSLARLTKLAPDVVIFDVAEKNSEFAMAVLQAHPGLPLIGLDLGRANEVLVLSGQQRRAFTANDLTEVILTQTLPQSRDNHNDNPDGPSI